MNIDYIFLVIVIFIISISIARYYIVVNSQECSKEQTITENPTVFRDFKDELNNPIQVSQIFKKMFEDPVIGI